MFLTKRNYRYGEDILKRTDFQQTLFFGIAFAQLMPNNINVKHMKVMLPIAGKETGKEKIARGFHNAQMVCIYDSDSKAFEWKETKEINPNPGDLTHELKRLQVNTIISGYIPPMVLQIFTRNGFSVLKARGSNVNENISFFTQNQLESFTSQAARELWGCDSGCNSCSSTSCKN